MATNIYNATLAQLNGVTEAFFDGASEEGVDFGDKPASVVRAGVLPLDVAVTAIAGQVGKMAESRLGKRLLCLEWLGLSANSRAFFLSPEDAVYPVVPGNTGAFKEAVNAALREAHAHFDECYGDHVASYADELDDELSDKPDDANEESAP